MRLKKVQGALEEIQASEYYVNRLLIEDRDKRISWKDYLNHPFFKGDSKKEEYIGKGKRYIFQRDFDIGFKSDNYR